MKKILLLFVAVAVLSACEKNTQKGNNHNYDDSILYDERDGNTYRTVKIGEQVWMSENLRYLDESLTVDDLSVDKPLMYVFNNNSLDVESVQSNPYYLKYGVYYNFPAAMNGEEPLTVGEDRTVRGICPSGWHLPSQSEWKELADYVVQNGLETRDNDGNVIEGAIAKALASSSGWSIEAGGNAEVIPTYGMVGFEQQFNNATGFNGIPTGFRADVWYHEFYSCSWWTPHTSEQYACPTRMWADLKDFMYQGVEFTPAIGLPVRCIKDK